MAIEPQRPTNPKFRASDLPNTPPALIFKGVDCTYMCWLYGDKRKNQWKICKLQTVLNSGFIGDGYNPITNTVNYFTYPEGNIVIYTYPYGSGGYNFHPMYVDLYDFDFLR